MPTRTGMSTIKVMIVDDHEVLRQGIKARLEREADLRIVGEISSGPGLFAALGQDPTPDVLLLDLQMGDFDAVAAMPKLRQSWPRTKILIVTAHDDRRHVRPMMQAGVDGYLLKDEDMSAFPRAIREVARGGHYYSQRVVNVALAEEKMLVPSPRECEVLALVAQSLTSADIAHRLGVSPRTVDTYVERARRKLGADSRGSAVGRAVELGFISAFKGGLGGDELGQ